ncbi:MAG: hypothetical protein ACM3NO_08565 [Deltaproteobacteria bacterium]
MPIDGEWWSYTANLVEMEKDAPGVFELGNPGKNVIFIASSPKVRASLLEHLEESVGSCIRRFATRYRVEYTFTYRKREEELIQEHVKLHGKLPRCNERFQ